MLSKPIIFTIFSSFSTLVTAHMELIWPIPFNSKFDASYYGNSVDWSNTNPLLADGTNFPCKHYHLQTHNKVQATYTAGKTYNISLTGVTTHSGGSCQISLSYDNGQSFQVVKSMVGGCPLKSNWNFTIPSDAPTKSDALLAWSWFNLIGNREMYMNCVRVSIQAAGKNSSLEGGPQDQRRRRRRGQMPAQKLMPFMGLNTTVGNRIDTLNSTNSTAGFASLPPLFACNVANGCKTIEKREVVFPKLGNFVEYSVDIVTPDPGPGYVITNKGYD